MLARYRDRTEHKSRAPNGNAAGPETHGLLRRRPVRSGPPITDLIGKEGNKLAERLTGEADDPSEYRNDHGQRADRWTQLVLPVLDELGAEIIQQTGLSPAGVYDVLNRNTLDPYNSARYEDTAVQHARDRLKTWEVEPPPENCALL